jgi:protein phosphatase
MAAGELTEEEAERDPRRSMITRALGLDADLEVDLYPVELVPGDRLLLCSDGLTTMVNEGDIATILGEEADPDTAAQRLVDAANDAGGIDNITALVIDVLDAHEADGPDSEPDLDLDPDPDPDPELPTPDEPKRRRRFFRR